MQLKCFTLPIKNSVEAEAYPLLMERFDTGTCDYDHLVLWIREAVSPLERRP